MENLLIGLTGQSGGGKTMIATLLNKYGYDTIDADIVSRKVVEPDSPCLEDIVSHFGKEILLSNGSLNRRELGNIVFQDREELDTLNNIIFPYIREEIQVQVQLLESYGKTVVFLDAPTLFESGADAMCDKVVAILAKKENRLNRILMRDKVTPEQAEQRLASQKTDDFFIERADYVIYNDGNTNELEMQVLDMLKKLNLKQQEV